MSQTEDDRVAHCDRSRQSRETKSAGCTHEGGRSRIVLQGGRSRLQGGRSRIMLQDRGRASPIVLQDRTGGSEVDRMTRRRIGVDRIVDRGGMDCKWINADGSHRRSQLVDR